MADGEAILPFPQEEYPVQQDEEFSWRPTRSFEQVKREIEDLFDRVRVQALDPDFLAILSLAIFNDILDITQILGITIPFLIIIDILVFVIIFFWMHSRGSNIDRAKEQARGLVENYIEQQSMG